MWPFRRKPAPALDPWDLSRPLVHWTDQDAWTIRDSLEGMLTVGASGSGKSSGSGETHARAMLAAGFGGVVFTVKPGERQQWERLCREAGRADDLVVFGPSSPLRYNFLEDEMTRAGAGAGFTENIVALLVVALSVLERASGGGGGRDDEGFWRRSLRQQIRNVVDLLSLATGRICVPDMYRVIVSAPTSLEQVRSPEWQSESYCFQMLRAADSKEKTPAQEADFRIVSAYWCLEFAGLSDKTRSVITSSFTSLVDPLNRGLLRDLLCSETNITPAAAEAGNIILLDMPIKEFGEVGLLAQLIWKLAVQRHMERRDVRSSPRPVFMWADEAHHLVVPGDALFQTTARSSRVATVMLTQTLSNFEAALGGSEKGKAETTSLVANLLTRIFHNNSDPATNEFASNLIGRTLQDFMNSGSSRSYDGWLPILAERDRQLQTSAGCSESYEFEVQPSVFSELRTGGPENRGIVEAIVFRSGRRFSQTGRPWMLATFQQRPEQEGGRHAA